MIRNHLKFAVALMGALLAAACGGGSDGSSPTATVSNADGRAVALSVAAPVALGDTRSANFGPPLWQVRYAPGRDAVGLLAVDDERRVFAGGKAPSYAGAPNGWLVRAHDARTGRQLWQDAFFGANPDSNKVQTIVAATGRVYAGGFASATANTTVAMVRAYNAATGAPLWEDRFGAAGFFASVTSLALDRSARKEDDDRLPSGLLYATGRALRPDFKTEWIVRAYDALTGAIRWQDTLDVTRFNDAVSVAAVDGRVITAGFTSDASALSRHFTVRSYDGGTGALLWQDRLPNGVNRFYGGDAAVQVAIDGDRVVAVGQSSDAAGENFTVRTYDTQSGRLIWQDQFTTGSGADEAASVAIRNGRAFVAGFGGAACSLDNVSDCDWIVRTYSLQTGALLWSRQIDGIAHSDDSASVVLACDDRVIVAGTAGTDRNDVFADALVQQLDAQTGRLTREDRLTVPGRYASPLGLAVAGNRLFVSTTVLDFTETTNDPYVLLRAFRLRDAGADDEMGEEHGCRPLGNNTFFF